MPAKCMKCGGVFDVSDDFKETEENLAEKEITKGKLLCWECRLHAKLQR
jgi:hypothetical protein